jgi:hypothetical protein
MFRYDLAVVYEDGNEDIERSGLDLPVDCFFAPLLYHFGCTGEEINSPWRAVLDHPRNSANTRVYRYNRERIVWLVKKTKLG